MIRSRYDYVNGCRYWPLILTGAIVLAGGAALAQQKESSLRVVGVDASDVLYLRAYPDPGATIIGAIPPGAHGIQPMKASAVQGWTHVRYGALEGWANARFLGHDPHLEHDAPLEPELECGGEEPTWTLTMKDAAFRLAYPWNSEPTTWTRTAAKLPNNRGQPWTIEAISTGNEIAAVAIITRTFSCGDGMSDNTYPYEIIVHKLKSETISGCCGDALKIPR